MSSPSSRANEAVCLALYSATHATLQLYRDLLAPWGLSYQQLMVLGLLWEHETRTPGEIAETLWLDSSSVAGLLRRMENAGLVARAVDGDDRRRVRVTSTGRGLEIRDEIGWIEDCLARAMELGHDDARELVSRLHTLRDTISAFERPTPSSGALVG